MATLRITRTARIPDPARINRYHRSPELGPQVLFFSGGSALHALSREIKAYTHNSVHLVTPFDSGGSSAKLRWAFDMPSIGDLRHRMMALADESVNGHPEIYRLFGHRLPKEMGQKALKAQLESLMAGRNPLIAEIDNPMRRLIRNQLGYIHAAMPDDFDLRGASIGNLILAGGYLNNHQHLDPIIFLFSKLVAVRGTVRTVINRNLHLGAELDDGRVVMGQHRITGKEVPPIESPIKRLFLSAHPKREVNAEAFLRKRNRRLIRAAELICYPPGSFYTSLIANLLPDGVARAIADNDCPKVYVPALGEDPEQLGMGLDDSVARLLETLRQGAGADCPTESLVPFMLVDSEQTQRATPEALKRIEKMGVTVVDTPLVTPEHAPYYSPRLLLNALLSLT